LAKKEEILIEKIEAIINDARERFNAWVGTYEPWQGENHTTERNLSFQFATAFLKKYPEGFAFMEVPFAIPPSTYNPNPLDAYLHTQDFDLLLECKNIYAPSHIKNIVSDIERMNFNLVDQIHNRHKVKPTKTHGVVFAETWYQHVSDWWEDNSKATRKKWIDSELRLPERWNYRTKNIYKNEKNPKETLFWLYGVSDPLNSSTIP
jgi:hypothetical protein